MQLQVSSNLLIPLISALVGGLLAILGNLILEWYRGWTKRRRLRRNLTVELREISSNLLAMYQMPEAVFHEMDEEEWQSDLLHPYYDAHRDNLLLLSATEIGAVDDFYADVDRIRNKLYHTESPNVRSIFIKIAATINRYEMTNKALNSPKYRLRRWWEIVRAPSVEDMSVDVPLPREVHAHKSVDSDDDEDEKESPPE